ncbi:Haloacid dehalogenase-like hydrolase [Pristimantis euphronides]
MAVISKFDRRLEDILRQLDLDGHFDFVLTSESAGVAKLDLGIFHKALKLGNVLPQCAAHFGDDFVNDYKAARQAGMFSFLFQTYVREDIPSDHLIWSLDELIPRLQGVGK